MNATLRAALLTQVRIWHWVSAGFCLVTLFLFAVTGFFLNHSDWLKTKPTITTGSVDLIDSDRANLPQSVTQQQFTTAFADFLQQHTDLPIHQADIDWDAEEIYLDFKSAGKTAWISVLPEDGLMEYEVTHFGTLAWLKDLHTGRNTGQAWRLYIDLFAIMTVIFTFTGLCLLALYQTQRKTTWAVVSTGIVLPFVIMLLFMHL